MTSLSKKVAKMVDSKADKTPEPKPTAVDKVAKSNFWIYICLFVLYCSVAYVSITLSNGPHHAENRVPESIPSLTFDDIPKMTLDDIDFFDHPPKYSDAISPIIAVMFYTEWCGHCKNTKPRFAEFANNVANTTQIRVMRVDAQESSALADRFGVKGYPTIFFLLPTCASFKSADASISNRTINNMVIHKYNDKRTPEKFMEFSRELLELDVERVKPEEATFVGPLRNAQIFYHCVFRNIAPKGLLRWSSADQNMTVCARSGCLHRNATATPGFQASLTDEEGPHSVFAQHMIWNETISVTGPDSGAAHFIDVFENQKLPMLIVFDGFANDSLLANSTSIVPGHIVSMSPGLDSVRELFMCGHDPCARFVVVTDNNRAVYGRPLRANETNAQDLFDALASEHSDGTLTQIRNTSPKKSSGNGTLPTEWEFGKLHELDADGVDSWMWALGNKTFDAFVVSFMQESCSHCKKAAPKLNDMSKHPNMPLRTPLLTFDLTGNDFPGDFGTPPQGTPALRVFFLKGNAIVFESVPFTTDADILLDSLSTLTTG